MAARIPLELVLVDKVSAPLKKANASADKFANTIKKTNGKLKDGSRSLKSASLGWLGVGKSAKAASVGIAGAGLALQTALAPLAIFTTAAAALGAAFKTLSDQDFAEAKFETLGGNSERLRGELALLSQELQGQASVTQLSAAAYDVASAGFTDAADAAKILKAASLGATGGFTDINTAGGAAVKVLNAYGKTADDAALLMDQFAQTQADGIITIGAYSQNIGKVATTAAGLKVPLAEVNAIIAQSTAAGVQTETAFTGLNAALAKISSGQAGKKLGIEMNEATLAADGLGGTLEKLQQFSTGELQQAFGIEAFKGIQVAIQDTEKFNKLLENQKNAQGAAARAAFTASDTLQGSVNRVGTAITNMFAAGTEAGEILKLLIKAVAVTIETLGVAVKIVVTPFRALWKVAEGFFEALGVGGGEMQALTESWFAFLKGIDVGFQKTYIAAEKLGQGIGNLAAMMKKPFKDAFQWIVARINEFWNMLPGWMRWSIKQITGTASEVAGAVGSSVSGFFTQSEDEKTAAKLKEVAKQKEIQQNKVLIEQVKTLDQLWKDIGTTIGDGVKNAIKGVVQGTQTLGQAAMNVLNSISNKLLDAGINALLGGVFGGSSIGKFLGFANGGRPPVGEPSIVGERGPELFVPGSAGTIIPNNKLGGGTTNNIVVNVDASGSSVEGEGQSAGELGRMLASAIQQELVRQQRPGGLLA